MGAGESMKFLAGSPYIRDLAALVVGYGMAINIVEVRETESERQRERERERETFSAVLIFSLFCFIS